MKNRKLYLPYQISNMSESSIRKAYSELRSIANKRIERLNASGLTIKQQNFPTIKELESGKPNRTLGSSLSGALADVSVFLRSSRTTVSGLKQFYKDFSEMMIEKGYDSLVKDVSSIRNTLMFLEQIREENSDKILSSGDALDVLEETERLKIPIDKVLENIDLFVAHLDDLENVQPTKGGRTFSSRRLNALVKKWEK